MESECLADPATSACKIPISSWVMQSDGWRFPANARESRTENRHRDSFRKHDRLDPRKMKENLHLVSLPSHLMRWQSLRLARNRIGVRYFRSALSADVGMIAEGETSHQRFCEESWTLRTYQYCHQVMHLRSKDW